MRIGFDAKRAFSNYTGLGNYSRDIIRILSQLYNQNEYFLYTPKVKPNKRLNFIKKSNNISICSPTSKVDKLFKSYWRSKSIVKDLLENNIEIFHGLSHELPFGIEKTNIKTVVTIHDLIFIRYPNLFSIFDRNIYYYKFKSSCERADKIIAISEQTKQDIISFFKIPKEKIEVVYQGCNYIFQKKAANFKGIITKYKLPKKFLLYVGSIEERKNLLTLLKTLTLLPKQKLVVIGNGKSYKKKCIKYIENNNLVNRVFFLSKIPLEDMAAIYQNAEMLIYPSVFEGFGIPILEALYSKIPVITSKGSCFYESGGPESIYINPLCHKEIKQAIVQIQKYPNKRNQVIAEGFKHAKKFNDINIAKNIISVYEKI